LRVRSGTVQNLAQERDALRTCVRFERKISHKTLGFVKDSVDRRLRTSNTGADRLEKAIKDKSHAACDLPGHDVPREQRIQAGPQLLQKPTQGNPWKRICIKHIKDFWRRLFAGENNCAVS